MSDSGKLTIEERRILLLVARQAIAGEVEGRRNPLPLDASLSERLKGPGGAFVTLKRKGQLRGCIGRLQSPAPLVETIDEIARAAATQDPRFDPVQSRDLADLTISISVLDPFTRLQSQAEIRIGTHGLYIKRGGHSGVLLPQVAAEREWDPEAFLNHTCDKAGLDPDAWKEHETEVYLFSAEEIEEEGG